MNTTAEVHPSVAAFREVREDQQRGARWLDCHQGPHWDVLVAARGWDDLLSVDMKSGDNCVAARVYEPDSERRWQGTYTDAIAAWGLKVDDAAALGFAVSFDRTILEDDAGEAVTREWRDLDQAWTEEVARRRCRRLLAYHALIEGAAGEELPRDVVEAYT